MIAVHARAYARTRASQRDGEVLSWGYARSLLVSQPPPSPELAEEAADVCSARRKRTKIDVHAEADAVAYAARCGIALAGATAHVTGSPCASCLSLLICAGVRRVVFVGRLEDHANKADHLRALAAGARVELVGGQPMPAFEPVTDENRALFRPDLR